MSESPEDTVHDHDGSASRDLTEEVIEDMEADCVVVNESDLAFFAFFVLMEAEGCCAQMGVAVTSEDVSRVSADFVTLFSSPYCWGNAHACPEDDVGNALVAPYNPNFTN